MAENQNDQGNQINIELPEDLAQGNYSNLAIISHSPSEFVLDFIQLVPNLPKAKVKSRVIMGPLHAKRLYLALQENIRKYQAQFGEIQDVEASNQNNFPPLQFQGPAGQA